MQTQQSEETSEMDLSGASQTAKKPTISSCLREAFQQRGLPASAVNTLLNSISESTKKQYNVALRKWWHYCRLKRIPMYTATSNSFMDFFQNILDTEHCSFGTFNSHPISAFLTTERGRIQHEAVAAQI
nr:unnamed protein product [Callosobruchus chinensis]